MGTITRNCKIFGLLALIGGPVLAITSRNSYKEHQVIEKEGVTVPALIMEGESKTGRRSSSRKLMVEFVPEGKMEMQKKTFDVPKDYWNQHVSGQTIANPIAEVRYLRADPNRSFLVGADNPKAETEYVGWGATGIGLLLVLFGFSRRD